MQFIFKAKDSQGKTREGKAEAASQEAVVRMIQKQGLIPLSIASQEKTSALLREIKRIWEGVKAKELVIFYRQLATLIDAKVPIIPTLEALKDQTDNKFLKVVIEEMGEDIKDGMSLSEGMAKHPLVFNKLAISMISSGEMSGNLQKSIGYIADNTEKNYQLSSKIKSALFYPAFVIGIAFIIGFIVITVILPRLTQIIKDMAVEVPWYTTVVMAVGDFMSRYWWAVLIAIFGVIGGLVYYIKSDEGKKEWDIIKLKMPILGTFYRSIYIARFSDNFSVLIDGGIPVVNALEEVSDVVGNYVFKGIIMQAAEEVRKGGTISNVFERSGEIPPIVTRMIKIGEETGKISEVLRKTAYFYEQDIDIMTRSISTMIEPILIAFLGVGVAVLVFSVLLPVYNIAGQIK